MHNKNTLFKIDCQQCWMDFGRALAIPAVLIALLVLAIYFANQSESEPTPTNATPTTPVREVPRTPVVEKRKG